MTDQFRVNPVSFSGGLNYHVQDKDFYVSFDGERCEVVRMVNKDHLRGLISVEVMDGRNKGRIHVLSEEELFASEEEALKHKVL